MGQYIGYVFQKKEGEKWIDIPTLYEWRKDFGLFNILTPSDEFLTDWDESQSPQRRSTGIKPILYFESDLKRDRGWPDDFEVCIREGDYHVVHDPDVLIPEQRECYEEDLADHGVKRVIIGYYNKNWLSGDEILAWWNALSYEPFRKAYDYFFDEVKRLIDLHGTIRFVYAFY